MADQGCGGVAAGAVALALGVITAGACATSLIAPDQQLQLASEALTAAVAASSKRPNVLAAKAGAAGGLAALLGAPGLAAGAPAVPSFLLASKHQQLQKQCLQASLCAPWQHQCSQRWTVLAGWKLLYFLGIL